jgi:biotin transport system substrate-specific component
MQKQKTLTGVAGVGTRDDVYDPPLALVLWPKASWVRDVSLVILGSLFVALAAQVAIPLPFTPVPITGQTFAVALIGASLGSKRAALALLTYLAEGALGLPVLAGGTSGLVKIIGPTGGYLVGFVASAFVIGWLCERGWARRLETTALAILLGDSLVFLFGLIWLSRFPVGDVFAQGLIPFLPGELIKVCLGALVISGLWRRIQKRKQP